MLGPQPHLAKNAVLAHRPGKLSLDNAFTLIEGHLVASYRSPTDQGFCTASAPTFAHWLGVMLAGISRETDTANDLAVHDQRDTALDRHRSFQREARHAGCPGSRGFRDPGEASVRESCWLYKLQLQHAPFVHADKSPLLERVRPEAAPGPIFGFFRQTPLH